MERTKEYYRGAARATLESDDADGIANVPKECTEEEFEAFVGTLEVNGHLWGGDPNWANDGWQEAFLNYGTARNAAVAAGRLRVPK